NRAAAIHLRRGYGGQVASGYGIWKDPERCFQCAGGAKPFRRIRKDFRAALSADSNDFDHSRRFTRAVSLLYCVKFWQILRPEHRDQLAQLVIDVTGRSDRVSNFLPQ